MTHHAQAPRATRYKEDRLKQQLHRATTKLFDKKYTQGMGATRLRLTYTESLVDDILNQPGRFRVIATAGTPKASQNYRLPRWVCDGL